MKKLLLTLLVVIGLTPMAFAANPEAPKPAEASKAGLFARTWDSTKNVASSVKEKAQGLWNQMDTANKVATIGSGVWAGCTALYLGIYAAADQEKKDVMKNIAVALVSPLAAPLTADSYVPAKFAFSENPYLTSLTLAVIYANPVVIFGIANIPYFVKKAVNGVKSVGTYCWSKIKRKAEADEFKDAE